MTHSETTNPGGPDADGFDERAGVGSLHSASEFSRHDQDAGAAAAAGVTQRPIGGIGDGDDADDPLPTMTATRVDEEIEAGAAALGLSTQPPQISIDAPDLNEQEAEAARPKPILLDDERRAALLAAVDDPDHAIQADPAEALYMVKHYSERCEKLMHMVVHLQARVDLQQSYIGTQANMVDALAARLKSLDIDPREVIDSFVLTREKLARERSAAEAAKSDTPQDGGTYP